MIKKEQLEEIYQHIKPYIDEEDDLHTMCQYCEAYCGREEHDYEECRSNNCFQFWLAYKYLEWENSCE